MKKTSIKGITLRNRQNETTAICQSFKNVK